MQARQNLSPGGTNRPTFAQAPRHRDRAARMYPSLRSSFVNLVALVLLIASASPAAAAPLATCTLDTVIPHYVDDPASWFSDQRVRGSITVSYGMDAEDYEDVAHGAYAVGWRYHYVGRSMVAGFFLGLAGAAEEAAQAKRGRDDALMCIDISIPFDETAPPEHCKDDLGTIIAQVLAFMDADDMSSDVTWLWRRVLIDLLHQRDELRRRGRIQ